MSNRRTLRLTSSLAALALLLGSCALAPPPDDTQQASPGRPTVVTGALPGDSLRLFSVAYAQIVDKYVEPVQLTRLVGTGLGNLQKIDPGFVVARVGDKFEARNAGTLVEDLDAPRNNDARRWAELTVATINSGRSASAQIGRAHV